MGDIASMYLDEVFRSLRGHKNLAEGAIAQLSEQQFFAMPGSEDNSVATIVKHMIGNMRSRFTDFLTSDGEKPDRHRDQEFVVTEETSRDELMRTWEQQWQRLFETVKALTPQDLERTVTIRGEPHSVLRALNRALTHYAYHTGQVAFLAKHWKAGGWKSLSIPKGQSEHVNQQMFKQHQK